jgi:isopentenyl phosphate kinase
MSSGEPREVVLVKLGGSLVTDKRRPQAARPAVIRRLAGELAAALAAPGAPAVALGHGSGSFGHAAAAEHGIAAGVARRDQLPGVAATQARAAELHRRIVAALAAAGAAPFSIAPSSALVASGGRPAAWSAEPVALALRLGLLPVVYGDVVLDRARGVAICSTEQVLVALAERLPEHGFRAARALWLGVTDGVLDPAGRTIPTLDARDPAAAAAAGAAAGTDVTGGMRHRVETALALARRGIESWILDGRPPGALAAALAGRPAGGTRVPAV